MKANTGNMHDDGGDGGDGDDFEEDEDEEPTYEICVQSVDVAATSALVPFRNGGEGDGGNGGGDVGSGANSARVALPFDPATITHSR